MTSWEKKRPKEAINYGGSGWKHDVASQPGTLKL